MEDSPLVSVVIPTHNREEYVEQAIASAVQQTYENLEIIVIDNCSTDRTVEIAEKCLDGFVRSEVIRNDENIGPVRNWHAGIQSARGQFVKLLFSDDMISKNFVERSVEHLHDEEVAFVIGEVVVFSHQVPDSAEPLGGSSDVRRVSTGEYIERMATDARLPYSPGCALFRRADLLSAFEFEVPNRDQLDFLKNGAGIDLLLFLNVSVNYRWIVFDSGCRAYFRSHSGSFSVRDDLLLYYEYAKLHFLRSRGLTKLIRKFKTHVAINHLRMGKRINILSEITEGVAVLYLTRLIIRKIRALLRLGSRIG